MAAVTLNIYRRILALSRRMLSLAQAEDWDGLIEQELARQAVVAELRARLEPKLPEIPPPIQAQINDLIGEILALDAQTSALTEQRLSDLGESLQSFKVSKQLSNTYFGS